MRTGTVIKQKCEGGQDSTKQPKLFFFLDRIHPKIHFSPLVFTFFFIASPPPLISQLRKHLILYHCRTSSSCSSVLNVHVSLVHFFYRFVPFSAVSQNEDHHRADQSGTLKIVAVGAVCAFMRLISLDNEYIPRRLTLSLTNSGHVCCSTEPAAERLPGFFLVSSCPTCMINISLCRPLCPHVCPYWPA